MSDDQPWFPIARRSVLRAAGASAFLLGVGAGTAVAQSDESEQEDGPSDDENGTGDSQDDGLDPIFGLPSAGPNPCMGDADEECFESFDVQPVYEVEFHIDLPDELFPFAAPGVLDEETVANINAAAADGTVDVEELDDPEMEVTAATPGGEVTLTVEEIATQLADTLAFHFEPTGIAVEPGDVVLFSAETPDHAFAAYHERHGRTNLVPDGVGPISSPLVPVGGHWLYQFETEGVYDAYCPPHEPFGMVMRVVVGDPTQAEDDDIEDGDDVANGDDTADGDDVEDGEAMDTGRPPDEQNIIPLVFGGLDPNLPSAASVLGSDALAPENIVAEESVLWETVVEEYRTGGGDTE